MPHAQAAPPPAAPTQPTPARPPSAWGALRLADQVGMEALAPGRKLKVKMGFDPTAPELHLGHAVGLLALRRMQDMGHDVALVVGDFTAAIGDPSGRDDTRPRLGQDRIDANAKLYAAQALLLLDPAKTQVLFNSSWLEKLGAAGMVALASKATVSQMLARADFAKRFKDQEPIGAHELLYPLLQARDSVELAPDVEFGGTDQRFNLLMGRELMREAGQAPQACAMVPLLVGLDGARKMSKSLGNHIGLAEEPADVFAKTMSLPDAAMAQWIEALGAEEASVAADPMEAKKRLASWIVEKLRGAPAAAAARAGWEKSRQKGDWSEQALPLSVEVPEAGATWASLLRDWGWESSAEQARQRMAQGALRLDGEKILDPRGRAMPGASGLLRYGSKRVALFEAALAARPALAVKGPKA